MMGDGKEEQSESDRPAQERRSEGERRKDDERRGPLRWDPGNRERRSGQDRRHPEYLKHDNDDNDNS